MTDNEALEVLGYLLGHEKAVDSGELGDVQNCLNSQEQEALSVILSEFRELKEKATERHFDEDAPDGYGHTCTNKTCAERIRSKAIEEFAEQIKARAHSTERNDWSADYMIRIWESVIDEIASELKGE